VQDGFFLSIVLLIMSLLSRGMGCGVRIISKVIVPYQELSKWHAISRHSSCLYFNKIG
jgi:hypothetical protein